MSGEKYLMPVTLVGANIVLQPFNAENDSEELFRNLGENQDAVFSLMPFGPFKNVMEFKSFFAKRYAGPDSLAFTVIDKKSGRKIGQIAYIAIVPEHRRLEIGGVWYIKEFHRTYANTEAVSLLLHHAFETLQYRRVEWKNNTLNTASQRAFERLGGKLEGVFRNHMWVKGQNRDSAYLSIIDSDWPAAKQKINELIQKYSSSNNNNSNSNSNSSNNQQPKLHSAL